MRRLGRRDILLALVTVAAALGALATTLLLRAVIGLGAQLSVLAVVLTLTFRRVPHRGGRARAIAAAEIPAVALAAGGVGWLLVHVPWAGGILLVLGLSVGIFARRFAPWVRTAGRLLALPFVALLVTPQTAAPSADALPWAALVALIAFAWSLVPAALVSTPATSSSDAGPPRRPSRRRIDPSTRMALQMAAGVAAGLVVGHALFGREWPWVVISAFLVQSGNRGRGDVVHKAGLRVLGGAAGTAVASFGALGTDTGDRWLLVALFAVMALALVLRQASYAWWAAGVTAMMALLHAYYGQTGGYAIGHRLVGIVVGSALGVAAAWWVLPVRTADVLRGRIADCLGALTADLAPDADPDAARFPGALERLDELAPTLRAHRRTAGRRDGAHAIDAIEALHRLLPLPLDPGDRRRLRSATVRVWRAMGGKDDPPPDALPPELAKVHAVNTAAKTSHNAHSKRLVAAQSGGAE